MSKYIYRQAGLGIYPGQTRPNAYIPTTCLAQRFLGPKVVARGVELVATRPVTCSDVVHERDA